MTMKTTSLSWFGLCIFVLQRDKDAQNEYENVHLPHGLPLQGLKSASSLAVLSFT